MMLRPKLEPDLGTSESCLGGRLERLVQRKSGWRRAGEGGSQGSWLGVWRSKSGEEEFSVRYGKCGVP